MKNRLGCKSKIVSIAKDFEKTLLHFENVWRVYLDCKSILSTANKELEKWVFPIGEEKQGRKPKNKKHKQVDTSE